MDITALNPHGIIALRDTAWIKREQDLTDMKLIDKFFPADDLRLLHLRQRYIAEKATGIGVVIAVGPGEVLQNGDRAKPEVQVGDRVIFGPHFGQPLKMPDGTEYLTIYSRDLRGILPPVPDLSVRNNTVRGRGGIVTRRSGR